MTTPDAVLADIDSFVVAGDKGFDKEAWMVSQIRDRVRNRNLNAICIWVGPTGSGKSYSALRMAELVDPDFALSRIVFRPLDFLDLINQDLPKASVILWDEMGLGMPAREWNSLFNKSIGYVLQSFRFRNLCLFMTVPDQGFIDSQARRLFHYFFDCRRIDTKRDLVENWVYQYEYDSKSNKEYHKHPIVRLETGPAKMRFVPVSMPSARVRRDYESKRKSFMDSYYHELRESIELTGDATSVPMWAWRGILALEEMTKTQAEIAGYLGVGRQHVSRLLRQAKAAVKPGR